MIRLESEVTHHVLAGTTIHIHKVFCDNQLFVLPKYSYTTSLSILKHASQEQKKLRLIVEDEPIKAKMLKIHTELKRFFPTLSPILYKETCVFFIPVLSLSPEEYLYLEVLETFIVKRVRLQKVNLGGYFLLRFLVNQSAILPDICQHINEKLWQVMM